MLNQELFPRGPLPFPNILHLEIRPQRFHLNLLLIRELLQHLTRIFPVPLHEVHRDELDLVPRGFVLPTEDQSLNLLIRFLVILKSPALPQIRKHLLQPFPRGNLRRCNILRYRYLLRRRLRFHLRDLRNMLLLRASQNSFLRLHDLRRELELPSPLCPALTRPSGNLLQPRLEAFPRLDNLFRLQVPEQIPEFIHHVMIQLTELSTCNISSRIGCARELLCHVLIQRQIILQILRNGPLPGLSLPHRSFQQLLGGGPLDRQPRTRKPFLRPGINRLFPGQHLRRVLPQLSEARPLLHEFTRG